MWDAAACTLRFVLRQHASGVGLLAFSPDNCWLVSVSGSGAGGLLVLWDLQAGDAAAIGKTQKVSMRVLFTCCACHLSFQTSAQPAETSFVSQQ